jgi:hypothetical protein
MSTRSVAAAVAAALLAVVAVAAADTAKPITVELKSFQFKPPEGVPGELFGYNEGDDKLFFYTNGPGEAKVKVPADGKYDVVIKASCDSALNEKAKFKLSIDGKPVGSETTLTEDGAKDYTLTADLKAGEHKLTIEFTNDVYKEGEYDRNLYVHGVSLKKGK